MTEMTEMTRGIQCGTCGVVNWPTAMCCMRCNAALDKRLPREVRPSKADGDMSFSQSLARVFEIIDFVLLLPATYGLVLSLAFIAFVPWLTLIIMGWFTLGCFLLRGFFRHSRGRLDDSQVKRLWLATMGYNMVDLIIMWMIALKDDVAGFYYLGLWPLLVVVFSAMALASESRRRAHLYYD
jgi:hypothetical protein